MVDLVKEYIKRQLKEKELREKRNSGEEKRYTITLSEYDYLRLAYISKQLGLKRSTLSRNLLLQALSDAEEVMGLSEHKPGYENEESPFMRYTEYGLYINGINDPFDDDSEDSDSDDEVVDHAATRRKGAPRGGPNK